VVNPACPAVAVAIGGTTCLPDRQACEFCLSAEQAGNSIAKFGLKAKKILIAFVF